MTPGTIYRAALVDDQQRLAVRRVIARAAVAYGIGVVMGLGLALVWGFDVTLVLLGAVAAALMFAAIMTVAVRVVTRGPKREPRAPEAVEAEDAAVQRALRRCLPVVFLGLVIATWDLFVTAQIGPMTLVGGLLIGLPPLIIGFGTILRRED